MALNNTAMNEGGTAIRNGITHFQLHSGAPGGSGTTAAVGSRVANTGSVAANGTITWSNIAFTGLNANQTVAHVSYWSAATGGVFKGSSALSGDSAANAAGAYTVTSITETASAT